MDVSESIRKLRKENDMTQRQLGAIAGVSAEAVSQWECGRAVPRMGAIQRLSDHFGVPKSTIMGDAISYAIVHTMQSRHLDELSELWDSISEDGRTQLMIYARGLAATYPREKEAGA